MITVNNIATALYGAYTKRKLNGDELNKWGLLYYNAVCSIPVLLAVLAALQPNVAEEVMKWKQWSNPFAVLSLFCSVVLGLFLNYSVFLCTQVTNATTTAVIGALKNI